MMAGVSQEHRYLKIDESVETWAKNGFKIIRYLSAFMVVVPVVAISFFNYFKTGGSRDAFHLIYPAM